jgi:hypothetical protein
MVNSPQWLAEKLKEEGEKTVLFFRDLPDTAWETRMYSDGAIWSVRDVLAHFVVTEVGIPRIMREVLSGGIGSPDDFDLDDYNRRHVSGLENLPVEALLERFAALRADTIRFVSSLSAADLAIEGRHPYLGLAPLVDMIRLMYRHIQIHQRDIRRALSP